MTLQPISSSRGRAAPRAREPQPRGFYADGWRSAPCARRREPSRPRASPRHRQLRRRVALCRADGRPRRPRPRQVLAGRPRRRRAQHRLPEAYRDAASAELRRMDQLRVRGRGWMRPPASPARSPIWGGSSTP